MVFRYLTDSYGDNMFGELNMSQLMVDEAYLKIVNLRNQPIFIYRAIEECIKCPFSLHNTCIHYNYTQKIHTQPRASYKILSKLVPKLSVDSRNNVICDVESIFKEFGVYRLTAGKHKCTLEVLKEPANIYVPIFTVLLIFFLFYFAVIVAKLLRRKLYPKVKSTATELPNKLVQFKEKRLKSLDTFRGIMLTLMIFLNYGGGSYQAIGHVSWYGVHLADLLFPCFLWIMGVCIPLGMRSRISKGDTISECLLSNFRRSCILFLLGVCRRNGLDLCKFRLTGVLQRLSICYLFHSSICFMTMKKARYYSSIILTERYADIVRAELSWLLIIILMIVHTIVIFFVPFHGCPRGYFGPGGYHEDGKYFNCTGGIAGYIDRIAIGKLQLYSPWSPTVFSDIMYDSEGLLGTLPSLAHCCFGVQAGFTLLTFGKPKSRIIRWLVWGAVTGLTGALLCGFSWSDGVIPLVKPLWTASFMLVTCSFAFVSFTICYMTVDVKKIWNGEPFIYPGLNSIAIYVGHYYTRNQFPFYYTMPLYDTHLIKLLSNSTGTMLWVLIAYYMYKRNIFIVI